MKIVKFKTTFGELKGCLNSENLHKLATIEMVVPEDVTDENVVKYIEKLTNLFVMGYNILEKH